MYASCPLGTGSSEKANSITSVIMIASKSLADIGSCSGSGAPSKLHRTPGTDGPPRVDVVGESK